MSDPITILQAMFDSGLDIRLERDAAFGGIHWEFVAPHLGRYEAVRVPSRTLEAVLEGLAESICAHIPDSNFARFHRGEINYFRCDICGKPLFGVEPVLDAESGECCPECLAAACRDEKVWSSECPGVPGWYWFKRADGRGMEIVRLVEGLEGMGAWSTNIAGVLNPETMRGQWWGPIRAPEV